MGRLTECLVSGGQDGPISSACVWYPDARFGQERGQSCLPKAPSRPTNWQDRSEPDAKVVERRGVVTFAVRHPAADCVPIPTAAPNYAGRARIGAMRIDR